MVRRINILKVPFDYYWPGRVLVSVIRQAGIYPVGERAGHVHPDIAEAALGEGFAVPFDPVPAKPATTPRRRATRKRATQATADTRPAPRVDRADLAPDDRPDRGAPVADAG